MFNMIRTYQKRRAMRRLTEIRTGIELARGVFNGRYDRFGTALAVQRASDAIRAGYLHESKQHGGICPIHAVPRFKQRLADAQAA